MKGMKEASAWDSERRGWGFFGIHIRHSALSIQHCRLEDDQIISVYHFFIFLLADSLPHLHGLQALDAP